MLLRLFGHQRAARSQQLSPAISPSTSCTIVARPTPARPAQPRCRRLDCRSLADFRPIVGSPSLRKLESLGIQTIGELMTHSAAELVTRLGGRMRQRTQVKRWRRSFRMMAELPCLGPADVTMLIAIQRYRAAELVRESPSRLHADLRRWSQSSVGNKRFEQHHFAVPDLKNVVIWIREAKRRYAAA